MSDTNSFPSLEPTIDLPPTTGDAKGKVIDVAGNVLLERLGIGGMGEVYRFGDEALQRDLAIKILRDEFCGNTDAEERFRREARLTGSLQHPGIVPIHNVSRLADGRPCYTMKLVRGRTLADLLRDEPERLPRLLAILEKVCQAVAYAHSKHVIHRDLKPSNVMVGEFGEVQVMDWGLAKELRFAEKAPPAAVRESGETAVLTQEGEGLSQAGSALGTPAYMPPEQAAGEWNIVDERADVFALGAILCEILTDKPPYHGCSRAELLRQARRGDLTEALSRLEQCRADEALTALCRDCLATDRLQRPRHAGMVAERAAGAGSSSGRGGLVGCFGEIVGAARSAAVGRGDRLLPRCPRQAAGAWPRPWPDPEISRSSGGRGGDFTRSAPPAAEKPGDALEPRHRAVRTEEVYRGGGCLVRGHSD